MVLINKQTLRTLTAEEVYAFRLAACGNQIDRDFERFTDKTLEQLATLFVGRPVLRDHQWSAGTQTARVYAASVESDGNAKRLVLRCYMPRTTETEPIISALDSGILRECSVGVAIRHAICSICGADQTDTVCRHYPGKEYDGEICHFDLDDAADAYEVSLVAVPAQPEAGAIKSKRYGGEELPAEDTKAEYRRKKLALEKQRYGGM